MAKEHKSPEHLPDEQKHPGTARGAKERISDRPLEEQKKHDDRRAPIGNGAVDEPAAFPPHN